MYASLAGLAGGLTIGAGLIHATAAGSHDGDQAVVVLFAVTAVVQVVLGATLAARADRRLLVVAALVNLAVAGAWLASRVSGLPIVDGLSDREAVGLQDLTATVAAVLAAVAALLATRTNASPAAAGSTRLPPLWILAAVPALIGMTAPHTHSSDEDHHGSDEATEVAADPIFSGADTSHASNPQLAASKDLILGTRGAMASRFTDESAVLAAGYQSIGDGRLPGTFEHFINVNYLNDGRELDPNRIESIVLENTGAGKRVASGMFILELGKTMADVPDIAGELTAWHDHQNLCWNDAGTRLAGLLVNGQCFPRGTFRPTPPMLHVWLQDHRCGPFAGIDGHGAACTGAHGH